MKHFLLNSSKINDMFNVFYQFKVIIFKIYHYILIYHKNILFFLFGFNIKLDGRGRFAYFQYIKGGILFSFIDKERN